MKKIFYILFLLFSLSSFASKEFENLKSGYFNLLNSTKETFEVAFKESYIAEYGEDIEGDFFILSTKSTDSLIKTEIELSPLAKSVFKDEVGLDNIKFFVSLSEKNKLFTLTLDMGGEPEVITGTYEEISLYILAISNQLLGELENY